MEEHNPGRESNALTAFDNMIADMINNKKLNPLVVESEILLFSSHNLISQHHKVLHETVHIFFYENSQPTRALANYISSFIRHWLWKLHEYLRKMYGKKYSRLVIHATLASDNNTLRFRKSLLERI